MLGKHPFTHIKSDRLIERLHEFEKFCMGETFLSPEHFMDLNKELALGAVLHIGRHRFSKGAEGKHLFWTDPLNRTHDLGPVDNLDVLHECPGFHRSRTLAIGQQEIVRTEVIDTRPYRRQMTMVFLKDGYEGVGPDFKTALRNAALKKHLKNKLKTQFAKASGRSFWDYFWGNA